MASDNPETLDMMPYAEADMCLHCGDDFTKWLGVHVSFYRTHCTSCRATVCRKCYAKSSHGEKHKKRCHTCTGFIHEVKKFRPFLDALESHPEAVTKQLSVFANLARTMPRNKATLALIETAASHPTPIHLGFLLHQAQLAVSYHNTTLEEATASASSGAPKTFVINSDAVESGWTVPDDLVAAAKITGRCVLFLHGFNNSARDSSAMCSRIAQAYEQRRASGTAPPVFVVFRWPSKGAAWRYKHDERAAKAAAPALVRAIAALVSEDIAVSLLSHSMGAMILRLALVDLATRGTPVHAVVCVAADETTADMRALLAPEGVVDSVVRRSYTHIYCREDQALLDSQLFYHPVALPRAGRVPMQTDGVILSALLVDIRRHAKMKGDLLQHTYLVADVVIDALVGAT